MKERIGKELKEKREQFEMAKSNMAKVDEQMNGLNNQKMQLTHKGT